MTTAPTTTWRARLRATVAVLHAMVEAMALSDDGATGYWGDAPQGGVLSWRCGNSRSDGVGCAHHLPEARRVRVRHETWVMPTELTAELADLLAGLLAEEEGIDEAEYHGAVPEEVNNASYEALRNLDPALRSLLVAGHAATREWATRLPDHLRRMVAPHLPT